MTQTTKTVVTGTGRFWGYTDEVDTVERLARRALAVLDVTFTVTDRKEIGSRGLFRRQVVSKMEYQIAAPTRREVAEAGNLINALARDVLS